MENSNKRTSEEIIRRSGVNPRKCMKCGKCSGTCPAYDEMEYHPHQFVYMVETGDIEPLLPPCRVHFLVRIVPFGERISLHLLNNFIFCPIRSFVCILFVPLRD